MSVVTGNLDHIEKPITWRRADPRLIDIVLPCSAPKTATGDISAERKISEALLSVYFMTMCGHELCASLKAKSLYFPQLLEDFRSLMFSLPEIGIEMLVLRSDETLLLHKLLVGDRRSPRNA